MINYTAKNQYRKFETNNPRKGIARPQSQFPHSCVCEQIYIFPRSICLFCPRKYVDRSWEYINHSQTYECGNWDWDRAIPRKGINKWDFRCSVDTLKPGLFLLILHCAYPQCLVYKMPACLTLSAAAVWPPLPPVRRRPIVAIYSLHSWGGILEGFLKKKYSSLCSIYILRTFPRPWFFTMTADMGKARKASILKVLYASANLSHEKKK
jgi:hypothetical protein